MGFLFQIIGTGIVSFVNLCLGIVFTWPSSTFSIFESTNTTLNRPMTGTELALFGSLSSIGAMISTPIIGKLLDVVGRKYCLIFSSLTNVIAWSIIAVSTKVELILFGIFLSGLSGAVFLVVPLFISEICQGSIRGTMTSSSIIFYSLGMLVSYLLGGFLSYNNMVYAMLSVTVLSTVCLWLLMETPTYLMTKGLEEEAAKSIAYYRNVELDSKEVLEEMETLRRAIDPDMEDTQNVLMGVISEEEQKLKPTEKKPRVKLTFFQFMKKSQSTRRAFAVSMILITASIFQGLIVVQVYAEPLFHEAIPNISSTLCSTLLALITMIAGMVAAYLTDLAGRKALMVHASIASSISCLALGTQIHLHWGPHYLTAVFMYMFCFSFTCGGGSVPYVIMAEVFLPEVRSIMSMLVIEWGYVCIFVILFIFNPLVTVIGLGPVFYIFSAISLLTAIFSALFVPETKGLPVDAIQLLFSKKSQNRV